MKQFGLYLVLVFMTMSSSSYATTQWESLYQQGNYVRATAVAKKALETAEQTLDANHPDVGTSLNSLALLYSDQGQYAEAEPLLKRAQAIFGTAVGDESPEVAATLNNLA